jgi:transposase
VLTDEIWERLSALLPPQKAWTGRPAVHHRTIVEGILFVMREGCSWRDLPARFGRWQTVADRYRRWRLEGIWEPILHCLLQAIPIASSA